MRRHRPCSRHFHFPRRRVHHNHSPRKLRRHAPPLSRIAPSHAPAAYDASANRRHCGTSAFASGSFHDVLPSVQHLVHQNPSSPRRSTSWIMRMSSIHCSGVGHAVSGAFAARARSIPTVVYAFSNRINVQVFSQWNNDSNAASFYVRLHIIPKIGSDVYGVLNQIMDTSGLRRRNLGRALRGKAIPGFQF